jgi:hypothetical protein
MKKLSIVSLVLLLVALGCKLPSSLSGGGGSATGGTSKGTATGGSDPRSDVIDASKKFIALPFFTANMEGTGQSEIKSQVEYVAPDKFHIKYLGGVGAGMEMIMIGKDSYMKNGDKWAKMPGNGGNIPNLRDSFTEEGLKSLTDAKFEGEDTIDGRPAMAYSYKNVTPVGSYPFTSKMWVSQKTGVPLRIYVEYGNGVLKNMTVNYDTDTPVTIEAPIK